MTQRIDTLTALEEADAEVAARQPITVLEDPTAPKVKIWCALAWVHKRREDPKLTFDDYLKGTRFSEALDYILGDPELEEGSAEEPFPEGGAAPDGAAEAGAADAEGAVLPRDGDLPG